MDKLHETKDLDLTSASRGVWLVKVPKYLSEAWNKGEPGAEVGKLVISKAKPAPGKQPEAKFVLNDKLNTDEKVPAEYTFNLTGIGNQNLSVMSVEKLEPEPNEDVAGLAVLPYKEGKVSVEGRVIHRGEFRPRIDQAYIKHFRNRVEIGNKPKKEIIQLDKAVISYKPKSAHETDIAYEMRKKEEGKKTRDDANIVQQALFGAFEKHQYYNIKDLVTITKQPIAYLKEILKEICVYNTKAPHKNMWELKPEYRHYGHHETTD